MSASHLKPGALVTAAKYVIDSQKELPFSFGGSHGQPGISLFWSPVGHPRHRDDGGIAGIIKESEVGTVIAIDVDINSCMVLSQRGELGWTFYSYLEGMP
jgi:hypothetical protein